MQRRRLPLGLLLAKPRQIVRSGGRILFLVRRKEAISWRMHFLGVASVVKVIWFRFRISAARELPLSTRPGFAPTLRVFTTSKSVTATLSSMNPSVMGRFTRIALIGNRHSDRTFIFLTGNMNTRPLSQIRRKRPWFSDTGRESALGECKLEDSAFLEISGFSQGAVIL